MLNSERKRDLEDLFWEDYTPPDHLDDEEWEYWSALSRQWNQALGQLYQEIIQQDNLRDQPQ